MQALILAAGMGKRLGAITKDNTKCMVKVNGVPLIERLLNQLSKLNLSRIIIVIGYKGDALRGFVDSLNIPVKIEYVENEIYDKTNNIYSLYLAHEAMVQDDTILIESDLILDDGIFDLVLKTPHETFALIAKYQTHMDGTMVRIDDENNIVNFVPKSAFKYSEVPSYYKTVNVYRFSKEFSKTKYVPFLRAYIEATGTNEYYEQVLRVMTVLDRTELKALPLDGEKWYEIDDAQDLDIAEALFAEGEDKIKKYFKRYGGYWRFPNILDFCYLVNPYFPTPQMRDELRANFDVLLAQYPSGMAVNSSLAGKYFGINPDYVCVGNGAAELIKSLTSLLEGRIGIISPTFEEYPNRCRRENMEIFIPNNADFSYTALDVKKFFEGKNVSNILIINPDNPSGNFMPRPDILDLAKWAARKNIRLVIDESFVDFADDEDSSLLDDALLKDNSNLIVVKSISKSYGVPGLRLGVMASSDGEFVGAMKKDVAIWNINSFAEFYLQIFGKYESSFRNGCGSFREERARFKDLLSRIPFLRVIDSQANYFMCEVVSKYTSAELTKLLLTRFNILIKDCGSKQSFNGASYIRLAVRDTSDNDKLLKALKDLI